MLDIGWSELVLIGIVALIVVGPKDLPRMFHALGRMTGKARGMAREFQRAMDDAAKASGLDEVKKDLNDIRDATSARKLGIDALEDAATKFEKWDPKAVLKPAAAAAPSAAAAAAPGSATAALAEEKAAAQAAARQKALELQAERTAAATQGFARKAAEAAPAPTAPETAAPETAPAPPVKAAARAPRTKPAAAAAEAGDAAVKPQRKPPVRKKKSEA